MFNVDTLIVDNIQVFFYLVDQYKFAVEVLTKCQIW